MPPMTYFIDNLIDTAGKRLVAADPTIPSQVQLLKREVAVAAARGKGGGSIMAPVYEALIAEPQLAETLGIIVTDLGKDQTQYEPLLQAAVERNKDKTREPKIAGHVAIDNTLYLFEFKKEPNLVQEATGLHMQRAAGDKTR